MAIIPGQRRSLLSSQARIQAPWIKVTIGNFTFGVFSRTKATKKNDDNFYSSTYNVQYPSYVQRLNITKINGQVNQYSLEIVYPVRPGDDPNFFEKVFSLASGTRKIVFSYGDASMPSYVYKDEEAIITNVSSSVDIAGSTLRYTVEAISGSALSGIGCFTFFNSGLKKPSTEIKRILRDPGYGLKKLFTGMNESNIDLLIEGDDKEVELESKVNISPLDYITYLASCMVPAGTPKGQINKDIYILTIHDDTVYDKLYNDSISLGGPYFKVTKTTYNQSYSDAYEIDIGYNTSAIVTSLSLDNQANYSIYYNYANELYPEQYVKRINSDGKWEDVYAPTMTSNNEERRTRPEDVSWCTKLTKFPINATLTIQGLLRPATLMTYVRLNIIFPGGRRHIGSGLYIVTKQRDVIDENGYRTTLSLTKISGDDFGQSY